MERWTRMVIPLVILEFGDVSDSEWITLGRGNGADED
jgi:hypothetical protein